LTTCLTFVVIIIKEFLNFLKKLNISFYIK
jgi:hypothetical protein